MKYTTLSESSDINSSEFNTNNLALSDDILLSIDKPARYIGREVNAVIKDKEKVDIRFAMCFPDVYEIGMSHLGIQILYDMFNSWEDVWCERVYSPWTDLDQIMRREHIPLFALESQEPVKQFDFLGITIQYEMCYTNILQILDLSGIPLLAAGRTWEDPIVIGGGPCTYNPEPIADFFDLFYIGEGETIYRQLLDLYLECKRNGLSRKEFLLQAAGLPGIYVPCFYDVTYREDGTIASFTPNTEGVPARIVKQIQMDLTDTYYPGKPVVPFMKITQDRVTLEIQRGCIRGCRFCQAGQLYRPVRERNVEMLKQYAVKMLESTGQEEISLSSLSSSDYSHLEELVDFLMQTCRERMVNISLPSLRIDAFSLDIMSKVQDIKKSSLTFAPEAGSQRLRDVINKGLTEEVILKGAAMAFEGGWTRVKLYFMLGLPTETEEDIRGIAELSNKIAATFFEVVPKEKRTGQVQIVASTSFFIPKPFTPFQWAPMCTGEEFIEKAQLTKRAVREQLNQKRIKYNWHESDVSVLEGVFARGDRKIAQVILKAYEKGCLYDSWGEYFHNELWMEAFKECGLDIGFYTTRERGLDEIFPWDFLDCGVSKEFLKREWLRAQEETVTPNCKQQCQGCGAARFGGGICYEKRNASGQIEDGSAQTLQEYAHLHEEKGGKEISPDIPEKNVPEVQKKTVTDIQENAVTEQPSGAVPAEEGSPVSPVKVRIKFAKSGALRFIGHLDVMRFFQKALRRAGIDVAYTTGFSPHQIMSFAQPLGLGISSRGEYMDICVNSLQKSADMLRRLNAACVPGIEILSIRILPETAGNAMASVAAARYSVHYKETGKSFDWLQESLASFLSQEKICVQKETKKGTTEMDLRPGIYECTIRDGSLEMLVDASSAGNIKPSLLLAALWQYAGCEGSAPLSSWQIVREETYTDLGTATETRLVPLEEVGEEF